MTCNGSTSTGAYASSRHCKDAGWTTPSRGKTCGSGTGTGVPTSPTTSCAGRGSATSSRPSSSRWSAERSGLTVRDPGSGPLTWGELDVRLAGLAAELERAVSRDDLQDVGRRAREILIDCARLLADPSFVPGRSDCPEGWGCEGMARSVPRGARLRAPSGRAAPVYSRCVGTRSDRDARRHRAGGGLRRGAGDRVGRAHPAGARGRGRAVQLRAVVPGAQQPGTTVLPIAGRLP